MSCIVSTVFENKNIVLIGGYITCNERCDHVICKVVITVLEFTCSQPLQACIETVFVSYIPQRVTTNTPFPWLHPTHCKQNNNYCTPFATISQNAESKHQVNCSNFGTVGKLTI